MAEKRLIDVIPLMKNGWHLVKTGKSNEFLASMSLADVPTEEAVEVAEYDTIVYKLECLLCHATGGNYSKAGYSLETMERMVTDYIEECCEEAVAEEVAHGYWINRPLDSFRKIEVKCSECGWTGIENYDSYVDPSDFNYCPNCGAKMDLEE